MRTASLLLVLLTAAHAQDLKPSAEIKALHVLAGEWSVEEKLDPEGKGHGSMVARVGPGGHSVIADHATITGPRTGYRHHEVFAWDPAGKRYRMVRVDGWTAGAVIAEGAKTGRDYVFERGDVRYVVTFHNDDRFDLVETKAGKNTVTMEFTRKSPPGRGR